MAGRQKTKSKKKMIILFIEIIIILIMVGVLYVVMNTTNNEGPKITVLDPGELAIPEEIQQAKEEGTSTMKGYMNSTFRCGCNYEERSLQGKP